MGMSRDEFTTPVGFESVNHLSVGAEPRELGSEYDEPASSQTLVEFRACKDTGLPNENALISGEADGDPPPAIVTLNAT